MIGSNYVYIHKVDLKSKDLAPRSKKLQGNRIRGENFYVQIDLVDSTVSYLTHWCQYSDISYKVEDFKF